MKDIIRRLKPGIYFDYDTVTNAIKGSIIPSWTWEVQQANTFVHRLGYRMLSYALDMNHEQLLWLSKFSYSHLDITKPFYVKEVASNEIIGPTTRVSKGIDILYDDIYTKGKEIPDLGQEKIEDISTVRDIVGSGITTTITIDDLDKLNVKQLAFNVIKNELTNGEIILSGHKAGITNFGRVVRLGAYNDPIRIEGNSLVIDSISVYSGRYILLPVLTITDSIVLRTLTVSPLPTVVQNGIINTAPSTIINKPIQIITRISADGRYSSMFDIDNDGFISNEDIQFIRDSIGKSINNTSLSKWTNIYSIFDTNKNGTIESADLIAAEFTLGSVRDDALVIKYPLSNPNEPIELTYSFFDSPHSTFFSQDSIINGGTLGVSGILPTDLNIRVKDGYYINDSEIIVGINIEDNQIWSGRRTSLGWMLRPVARPKPDTHLIKGITYIDNVVFVLVQSDTVINDIGLVRLDTLREVIEYTDDYIPLNITYQFNINEELSGLISTDRKDIFRITTTTGYIITVKLQRDSLVSANDAYLASADTITGNFTYIQFFNDIDNFAFNFGIDRLSFETNSELHARIKDTRIRQAGNDIQGMHAGISRELGIYEPLLSQPGIITLRNEPIIENIVLDFVDIPDAIYSLIDPSIEIIKETQQRFLGDTVLNEAIYNSEYTKYTYSDNSYITRRTMVLSRTFLLDVIKRYIKAYPLNIINMPNFNENLIYARNVRVKIIYNALDPNDIEHDGLEEIYTIDLPSIDQQEWWQISHDNYELRLPIHKLSDTAKETISIYSLHDENVRHYLTSEQIDNLMEDIKINDTSSWDKTKGDLSFFNEKFRSEFIIKPQNFDDNIFDNEVIEVSL